MAFHVTGRDLERKGRNEARLGSGGSQVTCTVARLARAGWKKSKIELVQPQAALSVTEVVVPSRYAHRPKRLKDSLRLLSHLHFLTELNKFQRRDK